MTTEFFPVEARYCTDERDPIYLEAVSENDSHRFGPHVKILADAIALLRMPVRVKLVVNYDKQSPWLVKIKSIINGDTVLPFDRAISLSTPLLVRSLAPNEMAAVMNSLIIEELDKTLGDTNLMITALEDMKNKLSPILNACRQATP